MSLPSFLSPCPDGTFKSRGSNFNYVDAIFNHSEPLGSAHALWWQPKHERPPDKIILFIPGNPGLLHFYIPFLEAIYLNATLEGLNVAILAHSHLGHTPNIDGSYDIPASSTRHGLTAQIQSHSEALDALEKEFSTCKELVLVGHSVGSWLCLQVSLGRPSRVSTAMLLFPTISHIRNTPNGRKLSWLFSPTTRSLIGWLLVLARFLPVAIISMLFNDWPRPQVDVLHYFVRCPSAIQAVLAMAHDEMETIRDLNTAAFASIRGHVWLYYGEKDDWVGKHKFDILKEVSADPTTFVRAVHDSLGIPHAFCIHHGREIGEQCSRWLNGS